MARPRKQNTAELHTAHVGFYATPAERAEIDRRAAVTGRHVSDYCRVVLLSDRKAPAPSVRDPAALNALALELARQGNNLNQLTRLAHEHHDMPAAKALAEVLALLKANLEKLFTE